MNVKNVYACEPCLSTTKLGCEMWPKLMIVSNLVGLKSASAHCHPYNVEFCFWIIIEDMVLKTIGFTTSVEAMGNMSDVDDDGSGSFSMSSLDGFKFECMPKNSPYSNF